MSALSTGGSELREAKGLARGHTAGRNLACLVSRTGGWERGSTRPHWRGMVVWTS